MPYNIEAKSPDEFLLDLFDLDPVGLVAIVRQQAVALRKPPQTVDEVLASIALHAPRFARAVKNRMLGL